MAIATSLQADLPVWAGAIPLISPNCADLAKPTIELKRFSDGESYVRLGRVERLKGHDAVILHRLYPDPDQSLVALLQMIYGAKEHGAENVHLILPYLPYSRADKILLSGEILSAKMLVKLLHISGASDLVTWDCHFLKGLGVHEFEHLKIHNLCAVPDLVKGLGSIEPRPLLVGPDEGARYLAGKEGYFIHKKRGAYESDPSHASRPVIHMQADFDVAGRSVVLVDDLIASGDTMIKAAQKMKEMGAISVSAAATHGLFLHHAQDRMKEAGISRILTSDTIPNPASVPVIRSRIEHLLHATGNHVS